MIRADVTLDGTSLRIELSGESVVAEGSPRPGHVVQNALKQALEDHVGAISEVVVDCTQYCGMLQDDPIWSVGRACAQKIPVRLVASGVTYESLFE